MFNFDNDRLASERLSRIESKVTYFTKLLNEWETPSCRIVDVEFEYIFSLFRNSQEPV